MSMDDDIHEPDPVELTVTGPGTELFEEGGPLHGEVIQIPGPPEPSESPSEGLFPLVGVDRTPTPEQIAEGRIGNGSWDLTSSAYEVAQAEIRQQIKADKDERRHFFNEEAKDGLLNAIRFHNRIIDHGHKVMDKVEKGDPDDRPHSSDMQILKMAQASSKELADRGMGRAKAAQEEGTTTSLLTLIQRKAPE